MKSRVFDVIDLIEFKPRSWCFAEPDADMDLGGGGEDSDEPSEEDILAAVDEDGEGSEPDDADELEEVELDEKDGKKKVKVTKGFKDHLLREADYRRKTHETAEEKRKIEAERAALAEERKLVSAFDDERAELKSLDKRLAEYDAVTIEQWQAWHESDPDAARAAERAETLLRKQREKLLGSVKEKYETLTAKEREKAKAWEEENSKIIKEKVPDWTPDKAKTVAEHIAPKFGLKVDALVSIKDAGVIALLNHVYKQDKAIEAAREKAKAARREGEPTPEPVKKASGGKTGAPLGPNAHTVKANPAAFDRAISKMMYGG